MSYRTNKERAKTRNTEPTMTEQSQARDTDINVIVGRFLKTGTAPGAPAEPMYGDFSQYPDNFREMIELADTLNSRRAQLPDALKNMALEELLALTPEALTNILTPPTTTSAPEGETK